MQKRIRLTIAVTPEVHAEYTRLAELAGVSVSRAMGDWLADTMEGAQLVALRMREAKESPQKVLRELEDAAVRARDGIDRVLAEGRRQGAAANASGGRRGAVGGEPPCSPTGVKVPGKGRRVA